MQAESVSFGEDPAAPALAGLSQWSRAIPLFHAAWLFALGISLSKWLWLRPSLVLVALVPVAALCGLAAFRAQRVVWLPVALLWLLLGVWCAEMEPQPAPAPALASFSDGLLRSVEGTITATGAIRNEVEQNLNDSEGHEDSAASQQQPSQRIDLQVSALEVVTDESDAQAPVTGGVRLTIRWPLNQPGKQTQHPVAFSCGERIRAVARLRQPEVYHDPGVWSREDYLLDQGITSTATVDLERVTRLGPASGSFLACRVSGLQHAASSRLQALPTAMRSFPSFLRLTSEDAVMLAAMVTGDRTYLTHSLRVGFERTGSFHMLVVSGFHLAIVAGWIFWVAKRLRLPRVPATLFTILASFAYALFTGFATPVQRSFWMVALYLIGRLLYRHRSPLNTIGFAALCLLTQSPRSLFESSFQMTLLAVVSIGGIAYPLLQGTIHPYLIASRDLRQQTLGAKLPLNLANFRLRLRMTAQTLEAAGNEWLGWSVFPRIARFSLRCVELLVVSCVVELAMALPMALYFHRITVFALPVNLFILPLLAVLMPAALLTLLVALVWPAAAALPGILVALPLHFGVGLVHLFGSLDWGDFRIATPLLWQSAVFCVLVGAAIVLACGSSRKRRLAWASLVAAALVAVAQRPIEHPKDALLVEAIDVGQGDSLLVITPDGKTLLIDGGGFGGGPRQATQDFDIGDEVVSPALWSRGIRHLDAVALSHAHSDHMGGLPAVLRNFHPDELWVGNNPKVAAYQALLDEAASLGVRLRSLSAGDALSLGAARINVLAPLSGYQPGAEPANNDSLVLRVAYGATSALFEGDAEASVEEAMLAETGLESTLLKVGHHGSLTSTRPAFLIRVAPRVAVISSGLHNRYGLPRPEILEALEAAQVRTYRTDLNGALCFKLDGKTVREGISCGP
jgi:competence protein ComEC